MLLTTHIWRNISRNSLSFWFAFWQKRSPTSGPPWSKGFFGQPRHAIKWMPLTPPSEVEMVTLKESMLDKSNMPHLHMPSASLTNFLTVRFEGPHICLCHAANLEIPYTSISYIEPIQCCQVAHFCWVRFFIDIMVGAWHGRQTCTSALDGFWNAWRTQIKYIVYLVVRLNSP